MPETLDLSKDQLIDFIKSETRNFLMEDVGEQIEENLEKRWADWEKMNGAERAKTEQAAFKSLLKDENFLTLLRAEGLDSLPRIVVDGLGEAAT